MKSFVGLLIGLAGLFPACLHAADELVIADNDFSGPATTNLQAAVLLLNTTGVRVLGLTVVSGDAWRDDEVAHTLRLLEIMHRTEVPVVPGAVFPLINSEARTELWQKSFGKIFWKGAYNTTEESPLKTYRRHGPFEVPSLLEGNPTLKPSTQTAAAFLIEQVHKYPHLVSIYAGGPFTNIALAIRLDPEFASLAKQLIFMGGIPAVNVTTKSVHAENLTYNGMVDPDFNVYFDPEAAYIALHAPWAKITSVGEITNRVMLTSGLLERIAAVKTPITEYLAKYAQVGVPLWDEMTAAVLVDPSLVKARESFRMDVDIDHGANYGNVRIYTEKNAPDTGEQPVEIVTDIDGARFTDEFVSAMQARP